MMEQRYELLLPLRVNHCFRFHSLLQTFSIINLLSQILMPLISRLQYHREERATAERSSYGERYTARVTLRGCNSFLLMMKLRTGPGWTQEIEKTFDSVLVPCREVLLVFLLHVLLSMLRHGRWTRFFFDKDFAFTITCCSVVTPNFFSN